MKLKPPATTTWPRNIFGNTAHDDQRNAVVSDFGDLSEFVTVVNHAEIDFVRNDEELIFFGNFDDTLDGLFAVNCASWIVWIDYENAGYFGMSLDLGFEVFEVGLPVVVWIKFVANCPGSSAERFHRGVCWVAGSWLNDALTVR